MYTKKELKFSLFVIYQLAERWNMTPPAVYRILNDTGILDNYIVACYDTLHTLGAEYLSEDITEFVREKGVQV
ncbi:MAG: DUF3791 domain-containing protein [Roseburia sp.]|nr:DUF3791 domain-containing protein [Roseburia sp.]